MCQEEFFQQAIWRHQGWGDVRMHNWNESPCRQWLECQAFHSMNHGMVFSVLGKIGHHSLRQDPTRTERCPRKLCQGTRNWCCKKYPGCEDRKYEGVITKEVQALPQHEWNERMKCSSGISLHEEPSSYFPKLHRGWCVVGPHIVPHCCCVD